MLLAEDPCANPSCKAKATINRKRVPCQIKFCGECQVQELRILNEVGCRRGDLTTSEILILWDGSPELTIRLAASFLGRSETTLYKWAQKGWLESFLRDGRRFFSRHSLLQAKKRLIEVLPLSQVAKRTGIKMSRLHYLAVRKWGPLTKNFIGQRGIRVDDLDKITEIDQRMAKTVQERRIESYRRQKPGEYTPRQLAKILGIDQSTLRLWARRGIIDHRKEEIDPRPRYHFTLQNVLDFCKRIAEGKVKRRKNQAKLNKFYQSHQKVI